MMLNRFSDPATLIAIGPNRVALFLEKFPDESKARNLVVPVPETHDPAVLENLAFALAKHSINDQLQTALSGIEAAARPENSDLLHEVIRRRLPCVSVSPNCTLDRALEVWFAAPDELTLFKVGLDTQCEPRPSSEVGLVTKDSPDLVSGRAPLPNQG